MLITADGVGGNGSRLRLWKCRLQRLANERGADIGVRHWPPGTRKWNKIEHCLRSSIAKPWRAKPLVGYRIIVNLISPPTTNMGIKVHSKLDTNSYPKVAVVAEQDMAPINIERADFHGDWNYSIKPFDCSNRATDPGQTLSPTCPVGFDCAAPSVFFRLFAIVLSAPIWHTPRPRSM